MWPCQGVDILRGDVALSMCGYTERRCGLAKVWIYREDVWPCQCVDILRGDVALPMCGYTERRGGIVNVWIY